MDSDRDKLELARIVDEQLRRRGLNPYECGHYDKDGFPISVGKWALLWENTDYREIRFTHLIDPPDVRVNISTIWLGLDHNFGFSGPPLIFETMVFGAYVMDLDQAQWRYATIEEARAGHDYVVGEVKAYVAMRRQIDGI